MDVAFLTDCAAFAISDMAMSMSCLVVGRPIDTRMDSSAASRSKPIAVRTCDGSMVLDEHALPVDISMPVALMITASARAPAILTLDVFGSLSAPLPFIVTPGTADLSSALKAIPQFPLPCGIP